MSIKLRTLARRISRATLGAALAMVQPLARSLNSDKKVMPIDDVHTLVVERSLYDKTDIIATVYQSRIRSVLKSYKRYAGVAGKFALVNVRVKSGKLVFKKVSHDILPDATTYDAERYPLALFNTWMNYSEHTVRSVNGLYKFTLPLYELVDSTWYLRPNYVLKRVIESDTSLLLVCVHDEELPTPAVTRRTVRTLRVTAADMRMPEPYVTSMDGRAVVFADVGAGVLTMYATYTKETIVDGEVVEAVGTITGVAGIMAGPKDLVLATNLFTGAAITVTATANGGASVKIRNFPALYRDSTVTEGSYTYRLPELQFTGCAIAFFEQAATSVDSTTNDTAATTTETNNTVYDPQTLWATHDYTRTTTGPTTDHNSSKITLPTNTGWPFVIAVSKTSHSDSNAYDTYRITGNSTNGFARYMNRLQDDGNNSNESYTYSYRIMRNPLSVEVETLTSDRTTRVLTDSSDVIDVDWTQWQSWSDGMNVGSRAVFYFTDTIHPSLTRQVGRYRDVFGNTYYQGSLTTGGHTKTGYTQDYICKAWFGASMSIMYDPTDGESLNENTAVKNTTPFMGQITAKYTIPELGLYLDSYGVYSATSGVLLGQPYMQDWVTENLVTMSYTHNYTNKYHRLTIAEFYGGGGGSALDFRRTEENVTVQANAEPMQHTTVMAGGAANEHIPGLLTLSVCELTHTWYAILRVSHAHKYVVALRAGAVTTTEINAAVAAETNDYNTLVNTYNTATGQYKAMLEGVWRDAAKVTLYHGLFQTLTARLLLEPDLAARRGLAVTLADEYFVSGIDEVWANFTGAAAAAALIDREGAYTVVAYDES